VLTQRNQMRAVLVSVERAVATGLLLICAMGNA
jgi:hypothetical protein